jgi:hypothetical protein
MAILIGLPFLFCNFAVVFWIKCNLFEFVTSSEIPFFGILYREAVEGSRYNSDKKSESLELTNI